MKKENQGTITVPVRRSFADKLIETYNVIAPADCQINNEADRLAVLTIFYLSISLICPVFLVPAARSFARYRREKGDAL